MSTPIHLAVALDGAGCHPAAWREPGAEPASLLTAAHWVALVQEAEAGDLDLVTLEDALAVPSEAPESPAGPEGDDDRTDRARVRLDAVLVACRVAPSTRTVGLVPAVSATHTEPFHVSTAIATLDFVSAGRAGVRVQPSPTAREARLVGRRDVAAYADDQARDADLAAEAVDHVEVQRRLWDSWEDDAEIRDVATGRFVDRDRLHAIDFAGPHFAVRGPSITPRPPQGQPLVVVAATDDHARDLAARSADVALVPAGVGTDPHTTVTGLRAAVVAHGRPEPLRVLGDLPVVLGDTEADARDRLARLDAWARERDGVAWSPGTPVFVGTAPDLADLLATGPDLGLDGWRLLPATLPGDLRRIARDLVPALQRRGLRHPSYPPGTLRDRLGLARPVNRYAAAGRAAGVGA